MVDPKAKYELVKELESNQVVYFTPDDHFLITKPATLISDEGAEFMVGDILSLTVGVNTGKVLEFGGYIGPKEMWTIKELPDINARPAKLTLAFDADKVSVGMGHDTPLSNLSEEYDPQKKLLRFGTERPDHMQLQVFKNLIIGLNSDNRFNSLYVRDI